MEINEFYDYILLIMTGRKSFVHNDDKKYKMKEMKTI